MVHSSRHWSIWPAAAASGMLLAVPQSDKKKKAGTGRRRDEHKSKGKPLDRRMMSDKRQQGMKVRCALCLPSLPLASYLAIMAIPRMIVSPQAALVNRTCSRICASCLGSAARRAGVTDCCVSGIAVRRSKPDNKHHLSACAGQARVGEEGQEER